MSGIVGIIHLDGGPVDRHLLQQLTDAQAFRGPNGVSAWADGCAGFGHTLLSTTDESEHERQPCSLDGSVWITADARIDGRAELIAKLKENGRDASVTRPDVELILHAYHVWGDDCVRHLLGDFAFAIWDQRQRRLFCARDQFGVRPFFYAQVGNHLIVSNTLNCVRLHPAVSDKLNEWAIADFLMFGFNQELTTTTFADIHRLPPAHTLTWSAGPVQLQRYWTLPTDGHIRYRRSQDYVDHFLELFARAVGDRIRMPRISVLMSGGLDSTSVAAIAKAQLANRYSDFSLEAHTGVFDHLVPYDERHYAEDVARHLDIPIRCISGDDYELYGQLKQAHQWCPEPTDQIIDTFVDDISFAAARHSPAVLTGLGGDALILASRSYFEGLLKQLRFGQLIAGAYRCWRSSGRWPRPGIRTAIRQTLGLSPPESQLPFPPWFQPRFVARLDLKSRWRHCVDGTLGSHPTNPEAHGLLVSSDWPHMLETFDPNCLGFPVEHCHPIFDLRLVDFMFAIPPIPWCWDKLILRRAMSGLLPEPTRRRIKTPMAADPNHARLARDSESWLHNWTSHNDLWQRIEPFVERKQIRSVGEVVRASHDQGYSDYLIHLRPLNLALWLQWIENSSCLHGREVESVSP